MSIVSEEGLRSYRMPNALIHSPRMVSFLAASTLDAILINEQLNPRKLGTTENKIRIRDIRWIANLDSSHNTDILEKVLDELLTVSAKWNMFGDDPNFIDVRATNFLQDYSYRKKSKDGSLDVERGFVRYKLTETVVEIIDKKTRETELNVISSRMFDRPYADRFYQLGKSFLIDKEESEDVRAVHELKEFLGVGEKYETYKLFNYEVMKPSLLEVSERSDIDMKILKTIRKNRKIYSIVFSTSKKREFQMSLPFCIESIPEIFRRTIAETEEQIRRENIVKRLKSFRMSGKNIDLVMQRGLDSVEASLMKAERQIARGYKYRFGNRKFKHDFILHGWEYIEEKAPDTLSQQDEEVNQLLENCGVDEAVRKQFLRDFDYERIKGNVVIASEDFKAGKTKTTLAAHVVSAIRTDYRPKSSLLEEAEKNKKEASAKAFKEKVAQQRQIKQWEDEFSAIRKSKIEAVWDTLSMTEQEQRLEAFRLTENATMQKLHAGKGLENVGFKMAFFFSFEKEILSPTERDFIVWGKKEKGVVLIKDKRTRDYLWVLKLALSNPN